MNDVASATPLNVSPIPRAVLVMGSDPQGYFSAGTLVVMGTGGQWRLLTAEHLGVTGFLDTAFELSADGTKVFVMDDARREVVIVTIPTARVQRFRLQHGMGLPVGWTRDGDRIVFTSESGVEVGWAMSARTGKAVSSRLGGRYAAQGSDGRNVALRASAGGLTELESWGGDIPADRVPLSTTLRSTASVAPSWQRYLVVDTEGRNPSGWAPLAGPVLLISPSTGQLTARLATPLPHVKWVQAIGEAADRWALLDVWDQENARSLVAWDYERKVLRPVISGQPSGQQFSLALDLLEER